VKFLSTLEADSEFVTFGVFDSIFDDLRKVVVGEFGVVNCDGGMTCMNDECLTSKSM
jgi:hypothetical protein